MESFGITGHAMYTAHFGLKDNPFAITPDPGYLYLSPHHQDALAHLLYGTGENGGFVQLTGEVGTGKTTLIRALLAQPLAEVDVALCLNPRLTVRELVATVCDELHVDYPPEQRSLKPLYDALNAHLLKIHAQGRRTVLIIDEAQNLSRPVLEQIRLLTNLETHRHKLLRIILVGQPELQRLLERQDMRQLAQRITARYHLMPLTRRQTAAYIRHRLKVAGGRDDVFTPAALSTVYRLSQGVPRLINNICDRSLLGAYGRGRSRVERKVVRQAAREALRSAIPGRGFGQLKSRLAMVAVAVGMAMFGIGLYLSYLSYGALFPLPSALAEAETNTVAMVSEPSETADTTVASARVELPKTPPQAAPILSEPSEPTENLPSIVLAEELALQLARIPRDNPHWKQLMALWGESWSGESTASPCEQVQRVRLRCLSGNADWSELRRFNRPALLPLLGPELDEHQVLLRTLDDEHAILVIGDGTVKTELTTLQTFWNGEYVLLWRPQITPKLIGPGVQGDAVIWLRQQLALSQGQTIGPDQLSAVFDSALQNQVRDFQQRNELQVDGLVGQRTMALLSNLTPTPDTPLLTSSAGTH